MDSKLRHPSILVVGNLTIDEIVGDRGIIFSPGGSAVFVSAAAGYLGGRIGILGNVGHDYPTFVVRRLTKLGLRINYLKRTGKPSTRFRITRRDNSRKLELLQTGDPITAPPRMGKFQAIHLGAVFNEIPGPLVKTLRQRCKLLSVDLQGFIRVSSKSRIVRTVPRNLNPLLHHCEVVQASLDEALSQSRSRDPRKLLRHFLRFNVKHAIVTMGNRGSWLGSQGVGPLFVPAFPDPEIVDSTGAGDIFVGSWLATYLSTGDAAWSSSVGSGFASLTSRKTGLSKFRLSRRELFRRAGWVYARIKDDV